MDKNAIKKYAVWARRELISRVSQRAALFGITEDNTGDAADVSVNGHVLSDTEWEQRRALIDQIHVKDYEQVMEEVAYTWFNRFCALRFMEVNGYLPSHVRVFTDEENNFKPQILTEAIHLELDGLDMEKVYALKDANDDDALFKYLVIVQCNALNPILPGMFQRIADYTELLFPDNLLRKGSVLHQMIAMIPEKDWKDAVQIIGWLYQYYNSEKKDEVFAALKKNVKITKENIPAATQLFTPDWIVRYMVENSLGRLWKEHIVANTRDEYDEIPGDKNEILLAKWIYYLHDAQQEPEVNEQLAEIRKTYKNLRPQDIKVIDPCMGSGHILVYAFDVLMQIYEIEGWNQRVAVQSILKHNLYGLDIDNRAAQLAYFSVMMKACEYDKRFLKRRDADGNPDVPSPHVYAIEESNQINRGSLKYFGWSMSDIERNMAFEQMTDLLDLLKDAKEYGSILNIKQYNWELLYRYARTVDYSGQLDFEAGNLEETHEQLWHLVEIAAIMAQKYDVVVTNPPYMGSSGMGTRLADYVKKNYPDSKSDLFAVFMERCGQMTAKNGYQAMITQHAWMFLSSFKKLRAKLLTIDIVNMAHLGARAFEEIGGEVVQTTSFVERKSNIKDYKGTYCRLIEPTTQQGKEVMFLAGKNRYTAQQSSFSKIPGLPVAYWVSDSILSLFEMESLDQHYDIKAGMCTGANAIFILEWYEVDYCRTNMASPSDYLYTAHNKGGEYRKWYGNREVVLKYSPVALTMMEANDGFRHDGKEYYFREHIGWSKITSGCSSFRYFEEGFTFDSAGLGLFPNSKQSIFLTLAFLNSCVAGELIALLNPTLNVTPMVVKKLPFTNLQCAESIEPIVEKNISLCQSDWDSFETSWDFQRHPLVSLRASGAYAWGDNPPTMRISSAYKAWELLCEGRFQKLKSNEEALNRIFIDIYGLQDELTPEVEEKDVTVRLADKKRDIKSLISYAVGCMFGRYSLDVPGLAYAGGDWDAIFRRNRLADGEGNTITIGGFHIPVDDQYQVNVNGTWSDCCFSPDVDNIIPICDDEYFEDDIVGRFVKFIEIVYGKDTLDENLRFIADALGGSGQPKDVIRSYFLNDFYADHLKIYQKRPIYWLFDSGKKNGFKCLIYMHRYQPDTIARIRTDYVHDQQGRYRTAIADLESRISSASTSERVKLNKQLKKLQEQAEEIRVYEEKIHHLADQMISIDLDDGVKKNYERFDDVLAKIK